MTSTMSLAKRIHELSDQVERLLRDVDRRKALLDEMRALGSRIDDAYHAFEQRKPTAEEAERLRAFQQETQESIEAQRVRADAIVDQCWAFHQGARACLLDAARREPALTTLAEQLEQMHAPTRGDSGHLALELLKVKQMLSGALELLATRQLPAEPLTLAVGARTKSSEALMSAKEVAELLQLSAKGVYRMAQEGKIPHVRMGRNVRFRKEDVQAWLARKSLRPRVS